MDYAQRHQLQISQFLEVQVSSRKSLKERGIDPSHAKIYTKLIPNSKFIFSEKEGHLSLLTNNGQEILRSVSE